MKRGKSTQNISKAQLRRDLNLLNSYVDIISF